MPLSMDDLAPWDAQPYFKTPTEVTIVLGANPIQVCSANPNRVALIFSTPGGGGTIVLSINSTVGSNQGIQKNATVDSLILTHRDVGPLVQQAWFASSQALGSVTVTEVILNRWPTVASIINAGQQADTDSPR